LRRKERELTAPGLLRVVHGGISVTHQCFYVFAVIRKDRNTNTRRYAKLSSLDPAWR
jgi:hypothetical protein